LLSFFISCDEMVLPDIPFQFCNLIGHPTIIMDNLHQIMIETFLIILIGQVSLQLLTFDIYTLDQDLFLLDQLLPLTFHQFQLIFLSVDVFYIFFCALKFIKLEFLVEFLEQGCLEGYFFMELLGFLGMGLRRYYDVGLLLF